MKVSIKNLHITFNGQGEPLESRLFDAIEKQSVNAGELATALNKAQHDLNRVHSERNTLQRCNERQGETIKAQAEELAQIAAWIKEYDDGAWPDHNAKGCGPVAYEVLHMMRDVQADLDSRPLFTTSDVWQALSELFNENELANHPQWPGSPMRARCWKVLNGTKAAPVHQQPHSGFEGTGWNASALSQPRPEADPLPTVQPAPETSDTQPAAPEYAMPPGPTGSQAPKAKICPEFNCSNFLAIGEDVCSDCKKQIKARLQEMEPVPLDKEVCNERADVAATHYVGECKEAEPAVKERPPCSVPLCDEPRRRGSLYCTHHYANK